MTITPFGLIFIPLGFVILVARPAWLLSMLIVSAVLQAFAVLIIGPPELNVGIGITPWLFNCGLICVHLIVIFVRSRRIKFDGTRAVKILFWGWIIFFGWCVLSAFTMPFIFQGTPVHALANWNGFDGPLAPLAWNRVGAIQAANAAIMGMLLVYIMQLSKDANFTFRPMPGLAVAILVGSFITITHKLGLVSIFSAFWNKTESVGSALSPLNILYQSLNPTYSHGFSEERASWPFSEPSYASVWYSGVAIGGVAICLIARQIWIGIFFIVVGISGLFGSLGGTGIAGIAIALPAMLITSAVIFRKKNISFYPALWRLAAIAIFVGLVAILYDVVRRKYPLLPDIYFSIQSTVQERISGPISFRGQSNVDAIAITKNTWGLGSGLGTNRASSYLLSMVSNIGIPGLALFLVLMAYQLHFLVFKSTSSSTQTSLILGGTIGMFCGMTVGIPDLLFPAWWIWLISGFATLSCERGERAIRHSPRWGWHR